MKDAKDGCKDGDFMPLQGNLSGTANQYEITQLFPGLDILHFHAAFDNRPAVSRCESYKAVLITCTRKIEYSESKHINGSVDPGTTLQCQHPGNCL
jgi:hypothetical protein